jgi:hypothetical protein
VIPPESLTGETAKVRDGKTRERTPSASTARVLGEAMTGVNNLIVPVLSLLQA